MHKSLDEFEIRPDAATGFHGNRLGYNGENDVITFSRTFLVGFISYLQVTMIYIRARMSWKFSEIRPWATELAAFECLKKIP